MVIGIPVVDGHDLTRVLINSLEDTMTGDNFSVVIIDNASEVPYDGRDYDSYSFPVLVTRLKENEGYYRPLERLYETFTEESLIGLIHNDMVIYERGWNERMEHSFAMDNKLALVGLCGSNEIDILGGRGGGTVCYFAGRDVQVGDRVITGQTQAAGRRTTDLVPSACLDSLFMMFKREAIPDLVTAEDPWSDLPLAHFIDRIFPCRLIQKGWHVATLGVECDHLGGMTTTGSIRFRDDCIKWLEGRNIPYDNPETELYLEMERRYFREFRDTGFFPCVVHGDYRYEKRS